nr:GNAT family N-acetyltransferase [uncultured Holophaga sp.]
MNPLLRPLTQVDLPEADRIFRTAFGTFIGLPDPLAFTGDAAVVASRFHAFPEGAFGVEVEGRLVGSVFASHWGSFGFFGPLSVDPRHWGQGLSKRLMGAVMNCFETWGVSQAGLYTFSQSPLHLGLYGHFGFRPRFLCAVMGREVGEGAPDGALLLSGLPSEAREASLEACRALAGTLLPGLDLTREIRHALTSGLGELLCLYEGAELVGYALCHLGSGSEGGSGACYVKAAAVRGGAGAPGRFGALLQQIEGLAASRGACQVVAGVNTARTGAYEALLERGYRIQLTGISLHRPNLEGFCHPGAWVLDDWR